MRRLALFVVILIAGLVAAFAPAGGILSLSAIIIGVVLGAIEGVTILSDAWDRFRPQEKRTERPTIPDEKAYLLGRLRAFDKEQAAFVALAGDVVIESRFDAYDSAFTPDQPGQRQREYTDIAQAVLDYDRFVIVGDPGAGKSTSLRQMAAALSSARLDPAEPRPDWIENRFSRSTVPLPLWINLGDSQNPPDAADLLAHWWARYNLPGSPDTAQTNLDLWLFLDGLNEMPEQQADRKTRAGALKVFLDQHPDIRAVVTCRVQDYDETLNLGLPVVRVQPLDDARAAQFVEKRLGDRILLDKLYSDDALKSIARNPYTLVMLIEVYRARGQLPANPHNLYELYVRERYRDYQRRGLIRMDWKPLDRRLQRLAFRMIADGKGTAAPTRWAQRQIGLRALTQGIGLGVLLEENGIVRFYHESLHIYFTQKIVVTTLQWYWYIPWGWNRRTQLLMYLFAFCTTLGDVPLRILVKYLNHPNKDTRFATAAQSWHFGAPAAPALIKLLRDRQEDVRYAATYSLKKEDMGHAVLPFLVEGLADKNLIVRLGTADILWTIQEHPLALSTIAQILGGPNNKNVRYLAAIALRNIGVPAIPVLVAALHDKDEEVRGLAGIALTEIGNFAVPALTEALKDLNQYVRLAAIVTLENIATPEALEALRQYRERDGDT